MSTLTTAQHDRLMNLVRRSPAFIGMRVVVHEDRVQVVEPHELEIGLGPVFDAVEGVPMAQWADLVDDRLNRVVDVLVNGDSDLDGPVEHVIDRIYARLRPVEGSPVEWWTYAPEIAPGLLMVLALDHPDRVAILNDDRVRQYGYDQLIQAGLDNLCGQLPETYAVSDDVYILTGGEYVGSTVLVMPWVVEAVTGEREYPDGVLVAMPNHGTLIFHVLRDGAAARYAMGEIARLAAGFHADASGPAPLTPYVYWLPSGAGYLEPVAHFDGDANGVIGEDVVTHYSADFATVLNGLR
ncbi:hypothetical protein [Actinosynnema sp. ALI-1.44]|uniref:hypothetical protein n=1 Tax=Actinosynnema sp. ALI-1.44 TaxID=1933779 RepID=UPI001177B98A|nr:hypothetical protein [Actinosynnema sp. ALI-1.44]